MTGVTTACFEPSLDYIVVKIPRWDLSKFTQVMAVEVMAMEVMAVEVNFPKKGYCGSSLRF